MRRVSVQVMVLTLVILASINSTTLTMCAAPPSKTDQRLKVEGDTVVIIRSLPFKVVAPPGADLYFWSFSDKVKASSTDNVLTVTAAPRGEHRVRVQMVTIDFDLDKEGKPRKKVSKEQAEIDVIVGEQPSPEPTPPRPDDPLVKSLKAALLTDVSPERNKHLDALSKLYTNAAKMDVAAKVKTGGELFAKMVEASRQLLPEDALPGVRKVIAGEVKTILTSGVDVPLTPEQKQRLTALFGRLGDALAEAGK